MAFTDTGRVDELHLADTISIRADDGKAWITGRVIALAYLGDEMVDIRVTLETTSGETFELDRSPDTMTVIEWGDDE